MAKVRQFGHIVVALEEELLDECIDSSDSYCNFGEKYSKDTSYHCQLLFAKYESGVRLIKQIFPELTVRLIGNPRTDFLRQELVPVYYPMRDRISRIISSKFVLINANTGRLNSNLSANQILELNKAAILGSSSSEEE